jgi:septum formation protein
LLYLASASPRRLELLQRLGFDPRVRPTGVDESFVDGESPSEHVARLARLKGQAAAEVLRGESLQAAVLAADTAVVLSGAILGKPADDEDARRMLRMLSGRTHEVLTAVYLERIDTGTHASAVECTRVHFRAYGAADIDAYVRSGEPLDKAGAYGIQGLGVFLTDGIEGSWSNVVGLPLERLPSLFAAIGLDLLVAG